MAQVVPTTLGESLYWSYAQVGMAFAATGHGGATYQKRDYMVRSRLYHGLLRGKLQLGSLFADEKEKLAAAGRCSYCGGTESLSLDHLIPRLQGGADAADNLVPACRHCNSSKGARDLLEWITARGELPTLVLLQRYLKLAIRYCLRHDLLGVPLTEAAALDPPLPFAWAALPHTVPEPPALVVRR